MSILIGLCGGPSSGKAQPLSALVLSPEGWKTMGEIKAGDEVFTPRGSITKVLRVFPQGQKEIYTITFHDGSQAECCLEHLWKCYYVTDYVNRAVTEHTVSTKELIRLVEEQKRRKSGSTAVSIPVIEPIAKPDSDLPIAPYLLGALLGDGSLRRASPRFTSTDKHIVTNIQSELPMGLSIKRLANTKKEYIITQNCPTNKGGKVGMVENPLVTSLKEIKIWGHRSFEKFIPDRYKQGSIEQRLSLLQGLLDTDGTVGKNGDISLTTTSHQLALDVQEIAWSLGGIASICFRSPFYRDKNNRRVEGRKAFEVRISYMCPKRLFTLPRKKERCKEVYANGKRPLRRHVKSIDYKGVEEAQCIFVDSLEHLYITNDYVVTHNTTLARALTNTLGLQGKNAEYVPEYAREHIALCDKSVMNNPRDLLHQAVIGPTQKAREDAVPEKVDFVVSDSPLLIHGVYTYMMTNFFDYNQKMFYLQHYQMLLENKGRYDYVFYLPPGDIEFRTDGLRKQDAKRAHEIGEKIRAFLVYHEIPFDTVIGTVEERVQQCLSILLEEKVSISEDTTGPES